MIRPSRPRSRIRGRRGFSLLEMLVVLGVLGLLMTLAAPALQSVRERSLLSRSVTAIRELVAQARDDAMRTGVQRRLVLDQQRQSLVVAETGRKTQAVPGTVVILTGGASAQPGLLSPVILFLPNGTGTGGRVTVERGGMRRTLQISWLTGAVSTDAP